MIDHIDSSHKLGDNKLSRLYQCAVDQCFFATNYISEFKSHNTFEHSAAPDLKCIYCNSKFAGGEQLVNHLQENIMKLIQCPLCPLASQMKSVILTHISQKHPEHPKRIITTSYTTCQKKLQNGDDGADTDAESQKGKGTRSEDSSDSESQEPKSSALKKKKKSGLNGNMNCNFVCGMCAFTTDVQDDFHDHIIACVKARKSPKAAAAPDSQETQPVVIVPTDSESETPGSTGSTPSKPQGTRERSRKSKPEKRVWNGTDFEVEARQSPAKHLDPEDVVVLDSTMESEDDIIAPEAELEASPRKRLSFTEAMANPESLLIPGWSWCISSGWGAGFFRTLACSRG